jgi:hypothetical protein
MKNILTYLLQNKNIAGTIYAMLTGYLERLGIAVQGLVG